MAQQLNGQMVQDFGIKKGEYHRTDGPAIEYADGKKEWYQNGQFHRTDGPAVEWADGAKFWYQNGKCHRLDGPAVEWTNNRKYWYIEGVGYIKEEYDRLIKTGYGKK
jgi:hypothetical protein